MRRVLVIVQTGKDREQLHRLIDAAPVGTRVEVKEGKRSLDQNAKMWASLTEVSRQVRWHGLQLLPSDWKLIFADALKREVRMVPNLDGTGFVSLTSSTSDFTKSEMADMITIIHQFGANHGVVFRDEPPPAEPR